MSTAAERHPGSTLDPFLLPAETDGRFRMLIAAAVMLVWGLSWHLIEAPSLLSLSEGLNSEIYTDAVETAFQAGFRAIDLEALDRVNFEKVDRDELASALRQHLLRWMVSITLLIVLVFATLAVYVWISRVSRRRAQPLHAEEAPRVVAEIEGMVADSGYHMLPDLWLKPGFLNGLAFGRFGSRGLAITGEAAQLESRWNDLHRAVTLHELGHIANDDIQNREISRAIWLTLSMILAVMLPVFLLHKPTSAALGLFFLQALGGLLLMWFSWSGLVRAREFYADWRVVQWGKGPALLRRLTLPMVHTPLLQRWWSNHPSNEERQRILLDPRPLFTVSGPLACLTGVLMGFVAGNAAPVSFDSAVIGSALVASIGATTGSFLGYLLGVFVPVLVVLGILTLISWWLFASLGRQSLRAALADLDLTPHWGYCRQLLPAVLLAFGVELGFLFTPSAALGWRHPGLVILWLGGLATIVWIWLVLIRAAARSLLGAERDRERLTKRAAKISFGSILLATGLFWPAVLLRAVINWTSSSTMLGLYPLVAISLLALSLTFFGITIGGLLTLALTWIRGARRVVCAECGEGTLRRRCIGAHCDSCHARLAPSFFITIPEASRAEKMAVPADRHDHSDDSVRLEATGLALFLVGLGVLALLAGLGFLAFGKFADPDVLSAATPLFTSGDSRLGVSFAIAAAGLMLSGLQMQNLQCRLRSILRGAHAAQS